MTIGKLLDNNFKKLETLTGSTSSARLEAEILLAFVLKKSRVFLLTNPQQKISQTKIKNYQNLIKKRTKNWPIAYLIGQQEFYGLNFKVTPDTLIPRPESEMIVDIINEETQRKQGTNIIDVGTGSGCLIISLAKQLGTNFNYYGLDISKPALKIANKNAKNNQVNIIFKESNLLNKLPKQTGTSFLAANLPYLTKEQIKREKSIKYEPKTALYGGLDGFDYYRSLFEQINTRADLKNFFLIIEIDPTQKKIAKKEGKKYFPSAQIQSIKDLRKKERFLIIDGR